MIRLLLILVLTFPLLIKGQINYESPPWDFECDSSYTQASMNRCSAEKAIIADSIMTDLFKKSIEYYNLEIKRIEETEISEYPIEAEFKMTIQRLKKSQVKFIEYRKSACEFEEAKWAGGSITPLMYNMKYLSLTVERIRLIESDYLMNKQE